MGRSEVSAREGGQDSRQRKRFTGAPARPEALRGLTLEVAGGQGKRREEAVSLSWRTREPAGRRWGRTAPRRLGAPGWPAHSLGRPGGPKAEASLLHEAHRGCCHGICSPPWGRFSHGPRDFRNSFSPRLPYAPTGRRHAPICHGCFHPSTHDAPHAPRQELDRAPAPAQWQRGSVARRAPPRGPRPAWSAQRARARRRRPGSRARPLGPHGRLHTAGSGGSSISSNSTC